MKKIPLFFFIFLSFFSNFAMSNQLIISNIFNSKESEQWLYYNDENNKNFIYTTTEGNNAAATLSLKKGSCDYESIELHLFRKSTNPESNFEFETGGSLRVGDKFFSTPLYIQKVNGNKFIEKHFDLSYIDKPTFFSHFIAQDEFSLLSIDSNFSSNNLTVKAGGMEKAIEKLFLECHN